MFYLIIISYGYNKRENSQNALAHAEIIAINDACKKLKSWRILNSTIYITLQPCIMCLGAILNAKINRIVFGARSDSIDIFNSTRCLKELSKNKNIKILSGVCEKESKSILKNFFKKMRR